MIARYMTFSLYLHTTMQRCNKKRFPEKEVLTQGFLASQWKLGNAGGISGKFKYL